MKLFNSPKRIRSSWTDVVLVCRKCTKKRKGGFGKKGRTSLAKMLRKGLATGKGRKAEIGIIEVGCLDICPKHGVTALRASAPRDWVVIPARASLGDVVLQLGLTLPDPVDPV